MPSNNTLEAFLCALIGAGTFAGAVSCSLMDTEKTPNIYGQWRWFETSGGFAGTVTRADSVSYTRRLVLNPSGIFRGVSK